MKTTMSLGLLVLGVALAACGEKPQSIQSGARKADVQAWQGGDNAAYAAAGWKSGDKAAWEEQMRNRAQGQNEYARTSAP